MINIILYGNDIDSFVFLCKYRSFSVYHRKSWYQVLELQKKKDIEVIIFTQSEQVKEVYLQDLYLRNFQGHILSEREIPYEGLSSRSFEDMKPEEIREQICHAVCERHQRRLREGCTEDTSPLKGSSAVMRSIKDQLRAFARATQPVLILGETGTGKNIAARMLHQFSCATGPLVELNCSAIGDNLFESTLFGHRKGSFTGAFQDQQGFISAAEGGSLFLDEIGDISYAMQPKLLKVIEERLYYTLGDTHQRRSACRFLCATNKDLIQEIELRNFRSDLYYRLCPLIISMPPLREHPEDIPEIAQDYIMKHATGVSISPSTMEYFQDLPWYGNVRELFALLQRYMATFPEKDTISISREVYTSMHMPVYAVT